MAIAKLYLRSCQTAAVTPQASRPTLECVSAEAASCPLNNLIKQSPPPKKPRHPRQRVKGLVLTDGMCARAIFAHKHTITELGIAWGVTAGVLTITFGGDVSNGEREKRFNSLLTNVIRPRYRGAVVVRELHLSGKLHYHVLLHVPRLDLHHDEVGLRREVRFWRRTSRQYGLGPRTTFEPLRDPVGYAKYMASGFTSPLLAKRRIRRVTNSGAAKLNRLHPRNFNFANGRAREGRIKTGVFATLMHSQGVVMAATDGALEKAYGKGWQVAWRRVIDSMPVDGSEPRLPLTDRQYQRVKETFTRRPREVGKLYEPKDLGMNLPPSKSPAALVFVCFAAQRRAGGAANPKTVPEEKPGRVSLWRAVRDYRLSVRVTPDTKTKVWPT